MIWISEQEMYYLNEMKNYFWRNVLWGFPDKEKSTDRNVKLAYVMIKGERKMLGVNNKTVVGYAMNETVPTWKTPLEEAKYDEFVCWCTSFDI